MCFLFKDRSKTLLQEHKINVIPFKTEHPSMKEMIAPQVSSSTPSQETGHVHAHAQQFTRNIEIDQTQDPRHSHICTTYHHDRRCKSPENLNLNLMKVKEKPTIRRAQVKIWRQRRACSCKMMSGLRMRHGTTVIFWVVSLMDAQDSTLLLN